MAFDLLLQGGHLIDPQNKIDQPMDLAITSGKIVAVQPNLPVEQAAKVVDVSGLIITPGLIDIHCHLYATPGVRGACAGDCSVFPDSFSFRNGITTMVDAGSAGWRNFEDFRFRVIDRAATRVFAMLNLVGLGMMTDILEQNVCDMAPKVVAAMVEKHSDVIVGIKSAHYFEPEWTPTEIAIETGRLTNLPVMVDVGFFRKERPYFELVTEKLRPGDITTHMYRAPIPYVNSAGKLYQYLWEARQRGVIFDVGHGGGSFVLRNAVPSIQQGFYPDTISTDLHTGSMNGAMMDLLNVMSKFFAMGMPLTEIIKATTTTPAALIKQPSLGCLSVGAVADIAVLDLLSGEFGYADPAGGRIGGNKRLGCELTIKDGQVVWDRNARMAKDYHLLGEFYDIREVDQVVTPDQE